MTTIDILENLNKRLNDIQEKIASGEINLLELELVPYFNELKDSLEVINLEKSSKTYKNACDILNQKFEELKNFLGSLNTEKKFVEYLKRNPSETEIFELLCDCWIEPFNIQGLSMDFLQSSRDRLLKGKSSSKIIEHLDKIKSKKIFILEVQKQKFTEKMINFYNQIQSKLPCNFEDVFEDDEKQELIYENFIYLLHLLQAGKIKYQKETNTLYI